MPGSCVDSSWRWRAVREEITGSPRLVALGLIGFAFLIAGVTIESDGLGTLAIVGAALLVVSIVLPIVSKASVGGSLFSFSFERTETTREQAIAALAEEYGATLTEVGRWLAGDDARVGKWVEQACALAYRDCLLVPRAQRDLHALCLLVRAVRSGIAMEDLGGADEAPRGALRPKHLRAIPFDDRAALVLRRIADLGDTDGAHVLHFTPPEFAARVERASAELTLIGDWRS